MIEDEEGAAFTHRLFEAILLLPPPYRDAMAHQKIDGRSRKEVLSILQSSRSVGPHGARKILQRGHGMLRAVLGGADPRRLWRRRSPQPVHNQIACCPLPPGDLRLTS